jgi:hypothetical protein
MQSFLDRHREKILGVLSGFDRMLFRGTLRCLEYRKGFEAFLATHRVLYKDFGAFAKRLSDEVKAHAKAFAKRHGRPLIYLSSPATSKEDFARRIMQRDGIQQGLICVLTCVELCKAFKVRRNRQTRHLEFGLANRKCLFIYFYFADQEFGLMHVRLQTWLPMPMQVCLNGREYLAKRLQRAGIGYVQQDNCFTSIDDLPQAQAMLKDLERRDWAVFLHSLARRLNPLMAPGHRLNLHPYYWSIRESEYATDVLFKNPADLKAIYPALINHAIQHFSCSDTLRFLGRRRTNHHFPGEASTNVKRRPEGVRIKHWVEENSIKMYDKEGSVLRIETTINNPRRFKVRRPAIRNGRPCLGWIPLRKSIADTSRRAEIGLAANGRYLEALGVVGEPSPTRFLLDPVSKPVVRHGRAYRPLRPIDPQEAKLFELLLDGQFHVQGFRNKDVRQRLLGDPGNDSAARKKAAGKITRLFRLLRAHRLIRKVSRTFYYRVTNRGIRVMTTALQLRELDLYALAA